MPDAPAATAAASASASRRRYLALLGACADRCASITLTDGTSVSAARVAAVRAVDDGGGGDSALVVVEGLATPLGTARVAALRAGDLDSLTVAWGGK